MAQSKLAEVTAGSELPNSTGGYTSITSDTGRWK